MSLGKPILPPGAIMRAAPGNVAMIEDWIIFSGF